MTAAIEGGEWSAARPGRTLPPGKTRYPLYRRLGGTQGRSGRAENLVPTWIRSRTAQPVVSRYNDWAARSTLPCMLLGYFLNHFSVGSSYPCYYWYGFCFYIPHFLCFCCKVFMFQDFLIFLLHHISVSRSNKIHIPVCLITDYVIRLFVMDRSVCLHCWFHNMFTLPSFPNMFIVILLSFHVKEDVKLMKLQISYDEWNSLFLSSSFL